jgi:hypothetical protein
MVAGKDYAAIAKSHIRQPETDQPRMPRLLVYGRNKKGKTHFGNTAPDVLSIDPDDQPKAQRPLWPVNRWKDMHEVYQYLRAGKHPYKWISIDGLTGIYSRALQFVRKQSDDKAKALDRQPDQIGKQHYGRANQLFESMLLNFHSLRDIGIVFTAQEKMVPVTELDDNEDDEDFTPQSYQYIVSLPKGARAATNQIVDLTGRLYVVGGDFERRIKVDGKWETQEYTKQRRLLIGVNDMYETGYRSDFLLPDVIEDPTVTKVVRALRTGVVK